MPVFFEKAFEDLDTAKRVFKSGLYDQVLLTVDRAFEVSLKRWLEALGVRETSVRSFPSLVREVESFGYALPYKEEVFSIHRLRGQVKHEGRRTTKGEASKAIKILERFLTKMRETRIEKTRELDEILRWEKWATEEPDPTKVSAQAMEFTQKPAETAEERKTYLKIAGRLFNIASEKAKNSYLSAALQARSLACFSVLTENVDECRAILEEAIAQQKKIEAYPSITTEMAYLHLLKSTLLHFKDAPQLEERAKIEEERSKELFKASVIFRNCNDQHNATYWAVQAKLALSNSHLYRYQRSGKREDYEKHLELLEEAINKYPIESEDSIRSARLKRERAGWEVLLEHAKANLELVKNGLMNQELCFTLPKRTGRNVPKSERPIEILADYVRECEKQAHKLRKLMEETTDIEERISYETIRTLILARMKIATAIQKCFKRKSSDFRECFTNARDILNRCLALTEDYMGWYKFRKEIKAELKKIECLEQRLLHATRN